MLVLVLAADSLAGTLTHGHRRRYKVVQLTDCLPLVRFAGGPVALAAGGHSGAQGTHRRGRRGRPQTADQAAGPRARARASLCSLCRAGTLGWIWVGLGMGPPALVCFFCSVPRAPPAGRGGRMSRACESPMLWWKGSGGLEAGFRTEGCTRTCACTVLLTVRGVPRQPGALGAEQSAV